MSTGLALLISGIVTAVLTATGGLVTSAMTNKTNKDLTDATNQQNAENVAAANAAQAAENEKSRFYNSAPAQVSMLRSAGMSKAAAIGALNNGQSYTPAAVNVAQAEASQMDSSGIISALSSLGSNVNQSLGLFQSNSEFGENLSFEKDKFEEEKLNNIVIRKLNSAQIERVAKENEVSTAQIKLLGSQNDLTISQIKTEGAKYDLSIAQICDTVEHTKLTAAQVLETYAQIGWINAKTETEKENKKLVKQQFMTEFENTKLKEAEKEIAWNNFVKVTQELNEFMSESAKIDRQKVRDLSADLLELQKSIGASENDIKATEAKLKECDLYYEQKLKEYDENLDFKYNFPMHLVKYGLHLLKGVLSIKL